MTRESYVLVTAARNEEAFIDKAIESIVSRTILPRAWMIVSDGSTDGTDEIVRRYAGSNGFIRLIRLSSRFGCRFGASAAATCSLRLTTSHNLRTILPLLSVDWQSMPVDL
jgi:glycosyltransferase involved in cell wall biosynthesis